ncbi:MAG: hypothetical protein N2578_06580, partial [Bdellovibrionaceae bacterium]|nr:hypothetical protein [Pseudobdellovibrionaceae bacterium]
EADYHDGRHPSVVSFSTPEIDARRRDFTVNALFFDPQSGQVIDYVGGIEDLHRRRLRTVGEAKERFAEDRLRLLRTIRFANQLGFSVDLNTWQAVCLMADQVTSVSRERIREELLKLFNRGPFLRGLDFLQDSGLLAVLSKKLDRSWDHWRDGLSAWLPKGELAEDKVFLWFFLPLLLEGKWSPEFVAEFRLTNSEKNDLRDIQKLLAMVAVGKRTGELLDLMFSECVRDFFPVIARVRGQPSLVEILYDFQNRFPGGLKPLRFLSGDDLSEMLSGKKLGEVLREVWYMQLEGSIRSREEALRWVQRRMQK